jgi:uncharacterized YigZ family protein
MPLPLKASKLMLFSDSYRSISASSEGQVREKGSKFLGFAYPVSSEAEIKSHLLQLRKEHSSASHHCYAWRLGADKSAYRTNDDGEPSGSAGKPIFSQILSNDLSNILIVVLRYFGGNLLGIPGLIQAYKGCAQLCLENANIIEKFIYEQYQINFDFNDMSKVMRMLKDNEAKVLANSYDETNSIVFQIKKQNTGAMERAMEELYNTKLKYIQTI